jgi:CubicO group peptidase (beta-lactamase class C family)
MFCCTLPTTRADQMSAYQTKVDTYMQAEMAKRHIPGASVAVVRNGKVILAKGYGMADVEHSVPASADTVYELGSITKQFTAMAILMLVEEGKVALDEKITHYLPDLPTAWQGVTVRHLLTHTSGIKSYTSVHDLLKIWRNDYTHEEIIKLVSKDPLEFQPGARWEYSNTNYFLLGMLIEKVTGKSYGDFLAARIFTPLHMTTTRTNDLGDIIKNRARGYTWGNDTLRNADYTSMTWPFSAGVLVSTVRDLTKWDAALATEKLVKRSSLQQMWTPVKLNDGSTHPYGFGWAVEDYQGHKLLSHGGGIPGFTTNIARFVDDRLTVIVLTNTDSTDPGSMAKSIAGLAISALTPKAENPIEDKDSKTTQQLKSLLLSTLEDKADPNLFTPEMQAALFPDKIKQAAAQLKIFGPLKDLQLLSRTQENKRLTSRYRVIFGTAQFVCTCVTTDEGKVAGLLLQPD